MKDKINAKLMFLRSSLGYRTMTIQQQNNKIDPFRIQILIRIVRIFPLQFSQNANSTASQNNMNMCKKCEGI
jgi:hypothetical protein